MKLAGAILFLCMVVLMGVGVVILTSIGNVQGARIFGAIALACCVLVACIPPSFWFDRRVAWAIAAFVLVALVAVHVPGLGYRANGSTRWIRLPGLLLQPSEFIKIAAIVLSAWWLGAPGRRNEALWEGVAVPVLGMGVVVAGFLSQPDLGSSIMLVLVNGALLFLSGARLRWLFALGAAGLVLLAVFLAHDPVRMKRLSPVLGPLRPLLAKEESAAADAFRPAAGAGAASARASSSTATSRRTTPTSSSRWSARSSASRRRSPASPSSSRWPRPASTSRGARPTAGRCCSPRA